MSDLSEPRTLARRQLGASARRAGAGAVSLLLIMILLSAGMPGHAQAAPALTVPDFEQLVEQNRAAIVNVRTTREVLGTSMGMPGIPEEEIPEFLRRFFRDRPGAGPEREPRRATGIGSGFVISDDGYILTNAHVVRDAQQVIVGLSDRRELQAEVVGADAETDIALLKVTAADLPTVELGDSDDLRVGQWVLAIGAPFGLEYTATQGIVSALSRSLPDDTYVPFIQTDVAVNPGNSGGPLFDLDGKVVGINSQIYSRTGGYMGLSFAIPINLATQVADQLRTVGYVTRGWLGVAIQDMDQALAESFGLDRAHGALVSSVNEGSPAAKGGLQTGDVIIAFNGRDVASSSKLPPLVAETPTGKQVPVEVIRNGKRKTLQVTVGERERTSVQAGLPTKGSEGGLGVVVAPLNPQEREAIGEKGRGVAIRQVDPQGPAARAGLQPNDVLLSFNRKDVKSPEELTKLVKDAPRDRAIAVLVQRADHPQFLSITIPSEGKG
jgi:serine protease Do